MPSDETPAVTEEVQSEQTEQTDASQVQSNTEDKGLTELLTEDLEATVAPPADKPEVAAQETETETVESEQEPAQPVESESQAEDTEEVAAPPKTEPKPNLVKKLRSVIKEKNAEVDKLRAEVMARVSAPPPVVQKPKEQTPEHWASVFNQNRAAQIPDTDPRQIEAAGNWERYRDEALVDRIEGQRNQREATGRATKAFVSSMLEVHEETPFLKRAENLLGFDLDFTSPLTQKMQELSTTDGVSFANNPAAILLYAQKAEIALLRQKLSGESHTSDTLKRKQAEAAAKGLSSGTRKAPPQPKSKDKQLDELQNRAMRGGRMDKEHAATAALAHDLGI